MSALGLPRVYWRLWGASTLANVGDGIREAALPLVAAFVSRDPGLVAAVAVAQRVPWLLLALPAGVLIDRVEPRRLSTVAGAARSAALLVLAVALARGDAGAVLLLGVTFVVGVTEVLVDGVTQAAVPEVVPAERLTRANSLLASGQIVANEFVGPPLGAALFLLGAAVPVAVDSGSAAVAAALLASLPALLVTADRAAEALPVRAALAAGIRHVWRSRSLRSVTLAGGILSAVDSAWFALLALYVLEELALGPVAFGLLLAVGAIGGLAGSVLADRVIGEEPRPRLMASVLLATAAAQVAIGLTREAAVVAAMLALTSGTFAVWNVASMTLRQQLTPSGLRGRVNAAIRTVTVGAAAVGAAVGGVAAQLLGLRAPVLLGAPLLVAAAVVVRRGLREPR